MSLLSLHNEETRKKPNGACDTALDAGNGCCVSGNGRPEEPMAGDHAGCSNAVPTPSRQTLIEQWENDFRPLLGDSPRWEGFKLIAADQLERESPVILETGTLRKPGDWKGDGQSTRAWDWIIRNKGGMGVSVDIDMPSVNVAQRLCPSVHCVCWDSVSFLRTWITPPTLLYLDSRDWGPGAEIASCMHQVAELTACWERLPSGCLVASDDSHSPDQGKPALTRRLLHMLNIEPILDSYIVVWRKP